jgi:glycerol kinase
MANSTVILAIDQGTTSSRTLAFDQGWQVVARAQQPFEQYFPNDGWVEHDPADIWATTLSTCQQVIVGLPANTHIAGIGITNQRETTVVWDRTTGEPVYNAIVWQDRRTADFCDQLKKQGHEPGVTAKTGLLLDPYFSASKIRWILENVDNARQRAEAGELVFGTIDSYLVWNLTGGKVHATDATNASRTMLYNIHSGQWDEELLELFSVPASMLPEVKNCADDFGVTDEDVIGIALPIAGVAGDQQAALVGQACFEPGMTKSTYGTGCFMVMNTGTRPVQSTHKLLTTIGYQIDGETTYALEGSIFNAGTTIQWMRDKLGLIDSTSEIHGLLEETGPGDNAGVYLVPAFTGLGAPHWDAQARGILTGITRDTGREHLVRAAIESVCYQTHDLVEAMVSDHSVELREIRVDGGMAVNNWMMQFLADITQVTVQRPEITETTALGAAYLAALQLGIYSSLEDFKLIEKEMVAFSPGMEPGNREKCISGWQRAVGKALTGPIPAEAGTS